MKSMLSGFSGDFIITFGSGLFFPNGRWSAKRAGYYGRSGAMGIPPKTFKLENPALTFFHYENFTEFSRLKTNGFF